MKDAVAGLAEVPGPYCAASRSLAIPSKGGTTNTPRKKQGDIELPVGRNRSVGGV